MTMDTAEAEQYFLSSTSAESSKLDHRSASAQDEVDLKGGPLQSLGTRQYPENWSYLRFLVDTTGTTGLLGIMRLEDLHCMQARFRGSWFEILKSQASHDHAVEDQHLHQTWCVDVL